MSNPWTRTQGKTGLTASGTTLVITPNTQPSLGDIIFVGVRVPDNTTAISSVVDDGGGGSNTYSQLGNTGTNPRINVYVTAVVRTMTAITITVGATTTIEAEVEIFNSGSTALGFVAATVATGTTETSLSVPSFTPRAGDLLIAFAGSSGVTVFTAGSGWTLGAVGGFSTFQYILNASGGAETAPITISTAGTGWSEKASAWRITELTNRVQARQAVKRAAYW